jgi:hypothetical protein
MFKPERHRNSRGLGKAGHDGKRHTSGIGRPEGAAAGGHLPDLPVDHNHLAVQGIESAEAQIAMSLELAYGNITVVGASRQCCDRGILPGGFAGSHSIRARKQ